MYTIRSPIPVTPKIAVRGRTFYYAEVGSQGDPLVFLETDKASGAESGFRLLIPYPHAHPLSSRAVRTTERRLEGRWLMPRNAIHYSILDFFRSAENLREAVRSDAAGPVHGRVAGAIA